MISETAIAVRSVSDEAREVYARRVARQSTGWALIFAALALIVATFSGASEAPTWILIMSWPFGGFVYALTHIVASIAFRYDLAHAISEEARRTQGEVALTALARLRARAIVEPRERSSFAPLLAGTALLGPLTVHWLAATMFTGFTTFQAIDPRDFTTWIQISLVVVGHAHVVFAISAARYARKMSALGATSLAAGVDGGGTSALTAAVVTAAVPGLLAIGIPPLLTGVTGLLLLPVFRWARRVVLEERRVIERACLPARDDLSPETFDEIRSVAEWKRGAPDVRALAIRALAERFSRARIAPVVDRVIESAGGFVRDSAIEVALAVHHRPSLELLLSIVVFAPPRTAQLIAASLAYYTDDAVEPTLINLLSRDERNVRIAAAEALGRVGTRVAVEPLLRLTQAYVHAPQVANVARCAIDRIQARMGPSDRGELSIIGSDDDRGALSMPAQESGGVSYPEE